MGYFDDIVDSNELIEKPLKFRGKSKTTYWRPLTAGQKLAMLKGQTISFTQIPDPDSEGKEKVRMLPVTEVQLDDSFERNQMLVQMTLCDVAGNLVYPKISDLQKERSDLIEALVAVAKQVNKETEDDTK